jgi:hypothetical protein
MARLVHGHTRRLRDGRRVDSPEYRSYAAMKNRCLNRRQARFSDYGGRGITICDRWLAGEGTRSGFECFLADLGPKPSRQHTLERLDNDRGYEPGNCRWATRGEQNRNTRATRTVDVRGEPVSLIQAIERHAVVSAVTVRMRLHRGWPVHDALLVPKGGKVGDADCRLWPAKRLTVVA